ncbi:MAG: tetratricopeptide repeat protein [Sphingomonadales bacterium]|nr:tetratricopeptide repeat protein [Sphingomonadales bacterium]
MALRPDRPQNRAEQLAQRAVSQQDAFLREVDDALREDQMFGAFRRYGKPIGAAVVLGLTALAGGLWYNSHREAQKAEQAEQLVLALDKIDGAQPDAAYAQLGELAKNGNAGSQTAARLLQAAIAGRKGQVDAAAGMYEAIAVDTAVAKPFRDLALVRGMALRFDKLRPEEVVARLKPLAVPGGAWFGSAGELLAAAYLKQGRKDLAGPLLVAISKDAHASDSLHARTRQLAGLLGYDAIDDIAKPSEQGAAPAAGAPQPVPAGPQPQTTAPQPAAPQPAPRATAARAAAPVDAGPISVNLPSTAPAAPKPAPAAPAAMPTP